MEGRERTNAPTLSRGHNNRGESVGYHRVLKLIAVTVMAIALVACMAGLLAACGEDTTDTTAGGTDTTAGGTDTTSTPATSAPAEGAKTIKVGLVTDFSLPLTMDFKKFVEAAVPAINAEGGLTCAGEKYQVELVVYDGKSEADASRSAVQRLLTEDKAQFILSDSSVDYWQALTEEAGVISIVGAPSQTMFDPKYKYSFQTAEFSSTRPATWLWAAQKFPEAKKVCAAFPDSLPGHIDSGELEAMCKYTGQEIVKNMFYPDGTTDFSAIATALVDTNADWFTTAGGGPVQDPLLQKAVKQAGFQGQNVMLTNICLPGELKVVAPEDLEGTLAGIQATDLPDNPPAAAIEAMEIWADAYGEWDNPTIGWWSTWYLLKAALEKSPSLSADDIAATINAGLKFECPGGMVQMVSRPDLGNDKAVDATYDRSIGYVRAGGTWEVVEYLTTAQCHELMKAYYNW